MNLCKALQMFINVNAARPTGSCNNAHNHYPFTMDKNSAARYKILRHIGSAQQACTGIRLHMTDCILLIIITTCQ